MRIESGIAIGSFTGGAGLDFDRATDPDSDHPGSPVEGAF